MVHVNFIYSKKRGIIIRGVIKPRDIHPPFVLGLRPVPRAKIVYEEDSDNHCDPENCAEDNAVLG